MTEPDDLTREACVRAALHYRQQKKHPLRNVSAETLQAARRALWEAIETGDADDPNMLGPVADAVLAAGLDAQVTSADTRHYIKISGNAWVVQHPLACRPNLFDCKLGDPTNRIAPGSRWEDGIFDLTVDGNGRLVVGHEAAIATPEG